MKTVGVFDTDDGELTGLISELMLKECNTEKAASKREYDVLILKRKDTDALKGVKAEYAVLLQDVRLNGTIEIRYAVNCGVNETDTLTPSSVFTGGGVASLRRAVKTLNGKIIEPCEIELGYRGNLDEKLAVAALKLILS